MKNSTYFIVIIPMLIYYSWSAWADIEWSRFIIIYQSLMIILMSALLMSFQKDIKKLEESEE